MIQAVARAKFWWMAKEIRQVHLSSQGFSLALEWLRAHDLGRKRIFDTQLAVTYYLAGVSTIVTSNPSDYNIFGKFQLIDPKKFHLPAY
jgi:hypothetical protein